MAARTNPARNLIRAAAVLAVALLAVGCTSGGGRDQAAQSTSTTAALAGSLRIRLVTSARVPEGGPDARLAAKRAGPGIERFLDRYLTAAFVDAAGGDRSWDGLLGLFDKPVRSSARQELDALSLGAAAPRVSAVRPGRTSARAVVLYGSRRPEAATVRLAFDGVAHTDQGSGRVHLRSVLQLLSTDQGWRIAAFDSHTGPPR